VGAVVVVDTLEVEELEAIEIVLLHRRFLYF
jgi:hypothetical protein